jgi:hypothetical protein
MPSVHFRFARREQFELFDKIGSSVGAALLEDASACATDYARINPNQACKCAVLIYDWMY